MVCAIVILEGLETFIFSHLDHSKSRCGDIDKATRPESVLCQTSTELGPSRAVGPNCYPRVGKANDFLCKSSQFCLFSCHCTLLVHICTSMKASSVQVFLALQILAMGFSQVIAMDHDSDLRNRMNRGVLHSKEQVSTAGYDEQDILDPRLPTLLQWKTLPEVNSISTGESSFSIQDEVSKGVTREKDAETPSLSKQDLRTISRKIKANKIKQDRMAHLQNWYHDVNKRILNDGKRDKDTLEVAEIHEVRLLRMKIQQQIDNYKRMGDDSTEAYLAQLQEIRANLRKYINIVDQKESAERRKIMTQGRLDRFDARQKVKEFGIDVKPGVKWGRPFVMDNPPSAIARRREQSRMDYARKKGKAKQSLDDRSHLLDTSATLQKSFGDWGARKKRN